MPSKRITELTALSAAAGTDVLVVVDNAVSATKNITKDNLFQYDNTGTALTATDIELAITELDVRSTSGMVISVYGRTGIVSAISGDYQADQVWFDTSTNNLSGTNVQDAIWQLSNTINEKIIYISISGSDNSATFDGSQHKPYATVGYALAQIIDNDTNNRYVILVAPGIYLENNPVQLKEFVEIHSISGPQTTRISVSNSDDLFLGSSITSINGLALQSDSSHSCINMSTSGSLLLRDVTFIDSKYGVFLDDSNAVIIGYNLTTLTLVGSIDTIVYIVGGKFIIKGMSIINNSVINDAMFITSGNDASCVMWDINVNDLNVSAFAKTYDSSSLTIHSSDIYNIQRGILAETSSDVDMFSVHFEDIVGTALECRTSADMCINGVVCHDCGVDLIATSATTIDGVGNYFQLDRMQIDKDALVRMTYMSDKSGDRGFEILGELHVGSPEHPSESVFGEGDSYSHDMLVYLYDSENDTYTDVSTSAASFEDSPFVTPTSADSAIYVASTKEENGSYMRHHGLKIKILEALHVSATTYDIGVLSGAVSGDYDYFDVYQMLPMYKRSDSAWYLFFKQGWWCFYDAVPSGNFKSRDAAYVGLTLEGIYQPQNAYGGNPVVIINAENEPEILVDEYYNGDTSAWEGFSTMVSESDGRFLPVGDKGIQYAGSYQMRYNANLYTNFRWEESDPMSLGIDYFWTRFRWNQDVEEGAVIEQIKLHSSRTEINDDGWVEYFGKGRPIARLPWDAGLLEAAAASPGDQDIYLSDNLDIGRRENEFSNVATDRIGFVSPLPFDCDTSTPIKLKWSVRSTAGGGDIDWVIRWGYSSPGGAIYEDTSAPSTHSTEQSFSMTSAAPLVADTEKWYQADIDISNMISRREEGYSDTLFLTIERTNGDGHAGDVALIVISAYYTKWCAGGHI